MKLRQPPMQRWLAALCLAAAAQSGGAAQLESRANPLRRVVDLLWQIKKKVEAEGQTEKELFNRYMCFCKTGKGNLESNIAKSMRKGPKVQGNLGARRGSLTRLESEITSGEEERKAIEQKAAEAKLLREQEAAAFLKESAEAKANIGACGQAVTALREAGVAAFLQTDDAAVLRRLVTNFKVESDAREALRALLHRGGEGSIPSSSVIGVLSVLKERFERNLATAESDEQQAQGDFVSLIGATKKEAKALTAAIEAKLERSAKLKVDIVETEDDQESTAESLSRDEAFMGQMGSTCTTLEDTYNAHKQMRGEEVTTISDTIKLLGSDEAQDLFRAQKMGADLGSPSFLQVSRKAWRKEALRLLRAARAAQDGHRVQLDLLMLALKGKHAGKKAGGFDTLIGMIEDMIKLGRKEAAAEGQKRDHCRVELRDNGRDLKDVDFEISGRGKEIQDMSETIKTTTDEVASLKEAIQSMDKAMEGATADREANHVEFVKTMASNRKSIEVLNDAKERLYQFYNPDVASYSPPEEGKDVSKVDEKINPNHFGPGAMHMMRGMTGLAQQDDDLEQPLDADVSGGEGTAPPNGGDMGAYNKASQASAGALELLEKIRLQVARDSDEAAVEEKNHAASYKMMLDNAKAKRQTLVHELMQKEAQNARMAEEIHNLRGKRHTAEARQKNFLDYGQSMHQDCSWLMQHYDARQAARTSEEDSLRQAKDVLAGA